MMLTDSSLHQVSRANRSRESAASELTKRSRGTANPTLPVLLGVLLLAFLANTSPASAEDQIPAAEWVGGNGAWDVASNWKPPRDGVPPQVPDFGEFVGGGSYTVSLNSDREGSATIVNTNVSLDLGGHTFTNKALTVQGVPAGPNIQQVSSTGTNLAALEVFNGGGYVGANQLHVVAKDSGVAFFAVSPDTIYSVNDLINFEAVGGGQTDFEIADGGQVTASRVFFNSHVSAPSGEGPAPTTGNMVVQGDLTVNQRLNVGFGGGKDEMEVSDGGTVFSATASVGFNLYDDGTTPGPSGGTPLYATVDLTGNDSSWNSPVLNIADGANGGVYIHEGGTVQSANTTVGKGRAIASDAQMTYPDGQLSVQGEGSTFDTVSLTLGDHGDADMLITGGGRVHDETAIVATNQSQVNVTLYDQGSVWKTDTDLTFGGEGGGSANLNVYDGAKVIVGGTFTSGASHSLTIVKLDDGIIDAAIFINDSGGIIVGNGTIKGHVINKPGGVIGPGFSPGKINIDGDLDSDGVLEMQIAGSDPGQFDQILVTGDASLTGTLKLSFLDGYTPEAGDTFELIQADGQITSNFDDVILPELAGLNLQTRNTGSGLAIEATPVPSPATLPVMLGLIGSLALKRSRRPERPAALGV